MTGRAATVLALSSLAVSAPVFGQDGGAMKNEQTGVSRTIVVIGASYAGGWNPERPLAGHQIITKGVSGEESSQVRDRFEGDVIALKPHGVIIWGFINDIFRSDRARLADRLQRTRNDLIFMVASARNAGIVPILATEVTIRNKAGLTEATASLIGRILGKESYQEFINRHVSAINEWIRETAAREKILLLDFETILSDERGMRRKEFAKSDGSHISAQGYEALTRYADERLTAFLASR